MSFLAAIQTCRSKFATFSGRAARPELWYFVLFLLLASLAATILNTIVFGPTITETLKVSINQAGEQTQATFRKKEYNGGWIGLALQLATVLPFLAVVWRRMHDIGRPGWHALLPILVVIVVLGIAYFTSSPVAIDQSELPPVSGLPATLRVPDNPLVLVASVVIYFASFIWVIVLLCRKSDGPNRFGTPADTQGSIS